GARARPAELADRASPRVEARAAARGVVLRARRRRGDHGIGGDRANLRCAGPRPVLRHGGAESRLHARDGRGGVLRRADHRVQLPRRYRVRVARSEGEVPMSAEPLAVVPAPVKGRSLWADAWAKLKHNRAAMVSAWI